ncbi:MAG: ferredoxin--NADP reductase [Candidatus Sericytochromatia bacterium]
MHLCRAQLLELSDLTPTVKRFLLDVSGQDFAYQPGQWVDFYARIDGIQNVAGYSIVSAPIAPVQTLELAVKRSGHPVAEFLHTQARVGDIFEVSNGMGDVFYDRRIGEDIVLLAGGIGVTPLLSMWRMVRDQWQDCRAHLIYTASDPAEFAYADEIRASVAALPERLRADFVLSTPGDSVPEWITRTGRLTPEWLASLGLPQLAHYFLCGPQSLVADCEATFRAQGVLPACIHYERW